MAHAHARLTQFGRRLLVQRITELGCPRARRRRVWGCRGPPPTSGWLATASRATPAWPTDPRGPTVAPRPPAGPGPSGAGRPPTAPPGPASARLPPGHGPLDGLWGAGPPRDEPAGPHRPGQRRRGALPAPAARRAGPAGGQEAGRIPDGGGHRGRGRGPTTPRGRGSGDDPIHSAVDDRSRVAFSQILPDEAGQTCARFLVEAAGFFAEHGARIERVLTDNAEADRESVVFAETAADLGMGRKRTRPYRPQTNGKVERCNKTCSMRGRWPAVPLQPRALPGLRQMAAPLPSPATTYLARRPDPDGGPRQQPCWKAPLGDGRTDGSTPVTGPNARARAG
jgi:Integrase core domain